MERVSNALKLCLDAGAVLTMPNAMDRAHRPFCLANLFAEVPLVHSCQAAPPSLTLRLEHPRTPSPLKSIISLALSRLLQPLIRPPLLFICFTTGLLSGRDLVILGPVFLDRLVSSSTSSHAVLSGPYCGLHASVSGPAALLATRPRLPERAHFPDPTNHRDTHRSRSIDDAFPNSTDTGLSTRGAVRHEGIGLARPHTADIRVGLRKGPRDELSIQKGRQNSLRRGMGVRCRALAAGDCYRSHSFSQRWQSPSQQPRLSGGPAQRHAGGARHWEWGLMPTSRLQTTRMAALTNPNLGFQQRCFAAFQWRVRRYNGSINTRRQGRGLQRKRDISTRGRSFLQEGPRSLACAIQVFVSENPILADDNGPERRHGRRPAR